VIVIAGGGQQSYRRMFILLRIRSIMLGAQWLVDAKRVRSARSAAGSPGSLAPGSGWTVRDGGVPRPPPSQLELLDVFGALSFRRSKIECDQTQLAWIHDDFRRPSGHSAGVSGPRGRGVARSIDGA